MSLQVVADIIFALIFLCIAFVVGDNICTSDPQPSSSLLLADISTIFAAITSIVYLFCELQSKWLSNHLLFIGYFRSFMTIAIVVIPDFVLIFLKTQSIKFHFAICGWQLVLISNILLEFGMPANLSILYRGPLLAANNLVFIFSICSSALFPLSTFIVIWLAGFLEVVIFGALVYLWMIEAAPERKQGMVKRNNLEHFVVYAIFMVSYWIIFIFCRNQNGYALTTVEISAYLFIQVIPVAATPFLCRRSRRYIDTLIEDTVGTKKRAFVRFVSHELRSHISSMVSGLGQLYDIDASEPSKEETAFDPAVAAQRVNRRRILAEIQESCDSTVRILDDILVYDRMRDPGHRLQRNLVDVKYLLKRSVGGVGQLMQKNGVDVVLRMNLANDVTADIAALKLHAQGDEVQQALRGVLDSAVRASSGGMQVVMCGSVVPGGAAEDDAPAGEVVLEDAALGDVVAVSAGRLRLEVVDKGPGMTQEYIDTLFGDDDDMDQSLHGGQASGLGLSIAKLLVERNGGRLRVQSSGPGTGCTFVIELPLYCVHLNAAPEAPPRVTPLDDAHGQGRGSTVGGSSNLQQVMCNEGGDAFALSIPADLEFDIEAQDAVYINTNAGRHRHVVGQGPSQASSQWPMWSSFSAVLPLPSESPDRIGWATGAAGETSSKGKSASFVRSTARTLRSSFQRFLSSRRMQVLPSPADVLASASELCASEANVVARVVTIVDAASSSLNAHHVFLFVVDEITGILEPLEWHAVEFWTEEENRAVVNYCFKTRRIVNVAQKLSHPENVAHAKRQSPISILCVPVFDRFGKCVGVLQALCKITDASFSREDEHELLLLAKEASPLITVKHQGLNFESTIVHNGRLEDQGLDGDGDGGEEVPLPVRRVLRFLVLDDVAVDSKILCRALGRRLGHQVDWVRSVPEALERLQRARAGLAPHDAVFISYALAHTDGAQVAQDMITSGFKGRVIGCTDSSVGAGRLAFVSAGAGWVVPKPVPFRLILQIVEELENNFRSPLVAQDASFSSVEDASFVSVGRRRPEAMKAPSTHKQEEDTLPSARSVPSTDRDTNVATTSAATRGANVSRCLVVDDVKSNRKVVRRLLERLKHEVEEAEDGLEALQAVHVARDLGQPFDFVFMDNVMPNLDGPGAARRLREQGFRGPIIGVTGNVLQADVRHYLSHGANIVLGKPLRADKVKEVMAEGYFSAVEISR